MLRTQHSVKIQHGVYLISYVIVLVSVYLSHFLCMYMNDWLTFKFRISAVPELSAAILMVRDDPIGRGDLTSEGQIARERFRKWTGESLYVLWPEPGVGYA